jgi:hypothetical protein
VEGVKETESMNAGVAGVAGVAGSGVAGAGVAGAGVAGVVEQAEWKDKKAIMNIKFSKIIRNFFRYVNNLSHKFFF